MKALPVGSIIHFLHETVDGDSSYDYYKAVKDFNPEAESALFKASDRHLVPCAIEGWDGLYAEQRYLDWLVDRGILELTPVIRIDIDGDAKTGLRQYWRES